jgi:outer membrane protein assembly factor BamB
VAAGARRSRQRVRFGGSTVVIAIVALTVLVLGLASLARPSVAPDAAPTDPAPPAAEDPGPAASPGPEDAEALDGAHGIRTGAGVVEGMLVFRGNPTRTSYGLGPVPTEPRVLWRYPERPMCSVETLAAEEGAEAEEKRWCGTGWTGQPLLRELPDGRTEVIVGAYDGAVHFVDADTGRATREPFRTGAMVKGTETLDPDGFPLLYVGSRDGYLRVVALDREVPTELWRLGRHPQGVWNDDWDANPTVVDDVLHAAGEDSWFRMVRLRRSYGADGLVTVDPTILVEVPAFDDALFAAIGDRNVSIESSPAVTDDRVYWVNSGGRVMGIDRRAALAGEVRIVLDVWLGDDADASIVVDRDGALYVALEYERGLARAREVGQLVKLDPERPDDPIVWGLAVPPRDDIPGDAGGIWATPAIHGDHLYVTTHPGDLLVVDRRDGRVVHRERIGHHEWSSPAVVADPDGALRLVVGTCAAPGITVHDLSDPTRPRELGRIGLPGCIESTPIVWKGRIYVGSRDGYLYGLG